jgi:hypothetical protein
MIGGGVIMLISAGIMNNPSTSSYAGPSILMGVGFGIAFVSYLQSLVTPFIFCDSYNKQLAVALKLRQEDINHLGIKMDTVVPLIGNILLGYGVGSFAQGDTFGGVTGIAGELSGIICFAAGIFSIGYPTSLLATNPTNRQEILSQVQGSTAAMIIGASVYGLTKIFEIIRPFWFAADYDKNLVMSKPGELHFAFDPYVVPAMTGDKVEMRFGLNLSAGI